MSMNKNDLSSRHFQRKISQFCELRIAPIVYRRVLEKIHPFLVSLIIYRESPPLVNGHIDWTAITQACGIEADLTAELKKRLQPGLDAIIRWLGATPAAEADSWPGQNGVRQRAAAATSTRKPQRATADGIVAPSESVPRGPTPTDQPFP